MSIDGLHHYTLRCDAGDLGRLRDFYVDVLGLKVGARPELRFPGHWLYVGAQPLVHLYASGRAASPAATALDHIAMRASGLPAMKARLDELGVPYTEAPVPGWPLHQVFVRDPLGLKIELTFEVDA